MTDVRQWLESLSLGQYGDAFEENAIEYEHLPDLDHAILQAIGIQAAGHRMTILKAAANFDAGMDTVEAQKIEDTARTTQPGSSGEAERRQLTIMFVDLVGSVELGARMDVEEYRNLLARFRSAVVSAVERYDGFVARHQGDGLLVYFGYPQAHENDAERAVRAGLEVVRAVEGLKHPYEAELRVRAGVATGSCVVGDALSTGSTVELAAFGPAPNLAARLQSLAEPNSVLVANGTYRLVQERFMVERLSALAIKGSADPVTAYRILAESEAGRSIGGGSTHRLTPLVGRELEVGLLYQRWQQAREGEGQVVLLSGEAGLGKTRLVRELQIRIGKEPINRVLMFCSPFQQNTALHPVREQLERALRFAPGDDIPRKQAKLAEVLTNLGLARSEYAPPLERLLSIPVSGDDPLSKLTAEQVRNHTLGSLVGLIDSMSRQRPVLVVVEDLHWLDATTQAFLSLLIERLSDLRILIVLTFRPNYKPPWMRNPQTTLLTINYLGRRDCAALVAAVAISEHLTESVINNIVQRTDGVPLFAEELTKSLIESAAGELIGNLDIPATLQDSLMARLDRLGPAKRIAQVGAVIGREFTRELVRAVVGGDSANLDSALESLESSELIQGVGWPGEALYRFRHALVQDTAYRSLLASTRRELHDRVGEAIETQSEDRIEEFASVLGHHYAAGHNPAQALPWFLQAGARAEAAYANEEAIGLYVDALRITEGLERSEQIARARMELAGRLGAVRDLIGEYAESVDAYRVALEEGQILSDDRSVARFATRLGRVSYSMGAIDGALEYFNQALQLAQQNGDVERMAVCYQGLGDTYFSSGRLRPAIESFQQALRIGEERGSDAGIATACTFLSNAHMRAGDLDEARDYGMRALEIGERLRDERRIAWACVILAQQFTERGELGNATEFLRRARTLMRRIGDYRGMAWTTGVEQGAPFCRWIVDSALRPEDVVEPLTEFAELSAASGGFQHEFAAFTAQLARAYLLMGRIEKAEAICLRVLEVANSMSNKLESGYAHMVLAEISATGERKDSEKTAHHLQKSITELSEAGAKTEVGRAHLVAARIALADMDFRVAKNDANSARLIFAKHGAISWEMEATAMLTKLESEASV